MSDTCNDELHSFDEMAETGLLWLINAAVFHPRGFAFAICKDADGLTAGWTMLGDGTDQWQFKGEHALPRFVAVEAFLNSLRSEEDPDAEIRG